MIAAKKKCDSDFPESISCLDLCEVLLTNPFPHNRARAAYELGIKENINDSKVINVLINAILNDHVHDVRLQAIASIGMVAPQNIEIINKLIAALPNIKDRLQIWDIETALFNIAGGNKELVKLFSNHPAFKYENLYPIIKFSRPS